MSYYMQRVVKSVNQNKSRAQAILYRVKILYLFSLTLAPIGMAKATLQESVSDGMLALASTFIAMYCIFFLVVVIYVCWKQSHE